MAVALLLLGAPARGDDRPTVAVDLTQLDAHTYTQLDGLALEKRIVMRLVQEEFAVVTAVAQPDVLVVIRLEGTSLVLEARGPASAERRLVLALGPAATPELHLEITHRILGLVRANLGL